MKFNYFKASLIVLMCLVTQNLFSYDIQVDGIYYNILSFDDLTCEVTSSPNGYSGNINIPSKLNYNGRQLLVTQIGKKAFAGCTIKEFHLPSSVKTIGDDAFHLWHAERVFIEDIKSWLELDFSSTSNIDYDCLVQEGTSLYFNGELCRKVTIPNGIPVIRMNAFRNVQTLEEVIIPEGVQKIESCAFQDCIKLQKAKIPSSCKTIGGQAFYNDSALNSVMSIPATIDTLYRGAFGGCEFDSVCIEYAESEIYITSECLDTKVLNLQRRINDVSKEGVKTYRSQRMSPDIQKLIIGPHVTYIPAGTFSKLDLLKELVVEDGSEVLSLGYVLWNEYVSGYSGSYTITLHEGCFYNTHIQKIYVGRELSWYEYGGFYPNSAYELEIKDIIIGDAVEELGTKFAELLNKCYNLAYISFGKNMWYIPDMSKVTPKAIVSWNTNPPSATSFSDNTYLNCPVYVPIGSKEAYQKADVWKRFWNIIEKDDKFLTSITTVSDKDKKTGKQNQYTISGLKTKRLQRGINIIQESDGTTKKIFVK